MKMLHKRILWIGATILFLIAAPLLLGYALGYRYNFQKQKIESTGIIYIKTFPRNAIVYVNDKLEAKVTPTQINYLLPGRYRVRVEKIGFFDWRKELAVQAGLTTFIEDVVMFRDSAATEMASASLFQLATLYDNRRWLAVRHGVETVSFSIFSAESGTFQTVIDFPPGDDVELLNVAPGGDNLIYRHNKATYLLTLQPTRQITDLGNLSPRYWDNFKWHPLQSNTVYSQIDNILSEIVIDANGGRILRQLNDVLFYFPTVRGLYYVTEEQGQQKLYLASDNLDSAEYIVNLPHTENLTAELVDDILTLVDKTNHTVYLLRLGQQTELLQMFSETDNISWYPVNSDKMLYWNENQINIYYPSTNSSILLTRLTDPIHSVHWHPNGTYVLYTSADGTYITETDQRDYRNVYQLSDIDYPDNLILNQKGSLMYIFKRGQGFFSYQIQ
ncbi:MAG: PEGA domain-containing protein [Candidatus Komeilibacteria bacterium]|nr:PEGA domain-containing protein [Candidatus Komeilibacteria bacterium]